MPQIITTAHTTGSEADTELAAIESRRRSDGRALRCILTTEGLDSTLSESYSSVSLGSD